MKHIQSLIEKKDEQIKSLFILLEKQSVLLDKYKELSHSQTELMDKMMKRIEELRSRIA